MTTQPIAETEPAAMNIDEISERLRAGAEALHALAQQLGEQETGHEEELHAAIRSLGGSAISLQRSSAFLLAWHHPKPNDMAPVGTLVVIDSGESGEPEMTDESDEVVKTRPVLRIEAIKQALGPAKTKEREVVLGCILESAKDMPRGSWFQQRHIDFTEAKFPNNDTRRRAFLRAASDMVDAGVLDHEGKKRASKYRVNKAYLIDEETTDETGVNSELATVPTPEALAEEVPPEKTVKIFKEKVIINGYEFPLNDMEASLLRALDGSPRFMDAKDVLDLLSDKEDSFKETSRIDAYLFMLFKRGLLETRLIDEETLGYKINEEAAQTMAIKYSIDFEGKTVLLDDQDVAILRVFALLKRPLEIRDILSELSPEEARPSQRRKLAMAIAYFLPMSKLLNRIGEVKGTHARRVLSMEARRSTKLQELLGIEMSAVEAITPSELKTGSTTDTGPDEPPTESEPQTEPVQMIETPEIIGSDQANQTLFTDGMIVDGDLQPFTNIQRSVVAALRNAKEGALSESAVIQLFFGNTGKTAKQAYRNGKAHEFMNQLVSLGHLTRISHQGERGFRLNTQDIQSFGA